VTPTLSAIVLCYRAEESILRVIEPLDDLLAGDGTPYELVLVANYWANRPDTTPEYVRRFADGRDHVVVVSREKAGAMGWDMRSGFEAAQGELMVVIDGDAQNPVEDVVRLFRLMRESGADVGKGRRIARHDGPYRRLISTVYNAFFRVLFGSRGIWDVNGKPKALTRSAYRAMTLESDDWFVDAEIVLEAHRLGLRVVELPVVFNRNDERPSFVRFDAIWEFVKNLVQYRLTRWR